MKRTGIRKYITGVVLLVIGVFLGINQQGGGNAAGKQPTALPSLLSNKRETGFLVFQPYELFS